MANNKTPNPDSDQYDINHPENLASPQFNSSTDKREGAKLPAIENMNDEDEKVKPEDSNRTQLPESDLGNDPKEDEKEKERIIRR